jgi:hypothetical protein
MTSTTPKPRAGEHTLAHEVADLSRTISTDSDGAFWGDFPDDHLGNIAGYIGRIEAQNDTLRERERELAEALKGILTAADNSLGIWTPMIEPFKIARALLAKAR